MKPLSSHHPRTSGDIRKGRHISSHNVRTEKPIRDAAVQLLNVFEKVVTLFDERNHPSNAALIQGNLRALTSGRISSSSKDVEKRLQMTADSLVVIAKTQSDYADLLKRGDNSETLGKLNEALKRDGFESVEAMQAYIDPLAAMHEPFQKALANAYKAGMFTPQPSRQR